MDNDVLELTAILPERQKARLRTNENPEGLRPDGSEYELVNAEEMSLVDIQSVSREFTQMEALWTGARGDTEQLELQLLLDGLACRLIDGPGEEVVKLSAVTKRAVIMRFFVGLNSRQLAALGSEGLTMAARIAKEQAA